MSQHDYEPQKLTVFLCHGKEDKEKVRALYSDLREDGADPWFDERNILPGQDWDSEIRKAVRSCNAIIVCLSATSVGKEGYVQKEIKFALDVADEKPDGTIFIIPVKLEECEVPARLSKWQYVNCSDGGWYEKLLRALRIRAEGLSISILPGDSYTFHNPPIEEDSGRVLYRSKNIRELISKAKTGKLYEDDIPILSTDNVVGISFEAMSEALLSFENEERRTLARESLLRMTGIRAPYHEWDEKNAKIHCFRNEEEEEGDDDFEMIPVSSSNIKAIGYNRKRQVLRVAFKPNALYEYYAIPEYLYNGLMSADSHGKYLNRYIKVPSYAYRQIH